MHWADKNSSVTLEVNPTKNYLEIENWLFLKEATLVQKKDATLEKKRQAGREGGRILTLQESNEAGNASQGLSSDSKYKVLLSDKQGKGAKVLLGTLSLRQNTRTRRKRHLYGL